MNHLTRMHFLQRGKDYRTPELRPGTHLPPREVFTGEADVLDLYDRWTALTDAEQRHQRDARDKRARAATAAADYKAGVAAALATGTDPAKVKNDQPRLTAEAEAHEGMAAEAKAELRRLARPLAVAITEAAPRRLDDVDRQMREAAKSVTATMAGLTEAWNTWGAAWHLRRILGDAALYGGTLAEYRSTATMPAEAAAALATLTDRLADLERLHHDEAQVKAWRAQEQAARDANARRLADTVKSA